MERPTDAQDCIICNKAARDAMHSAGAIQITEELLKDRPADMLKEKCGVSCWNCYDIGYTSQTEEYQNQLKARIVLALGWGEIVQ